VDMRPFEKLARIRHLFESFPGHEEVFPAVELAVSRCARGEGNRIAKIRYLLQHALNQRALTATGRGTHNEKNAAPFICFGSAFGLEATLV